MHLLDGTPLAYKSHALRLFYLHVPWLRCYTFALTTVTPYKIVPKQITTKGVEKEWKKIYFKTRLLLENSGEYERRLMSYNTLNALLRRKTYIRPKLEN